MDLSVLQNGSDIRGVAVKTPGSEVNFDGEAAFRIGAAFVQFLREKYKKDRPSAAIGRDPRISGPDLLEQAAKGMYSEGAERVYDFGISTTPAMCVSTKDPSMNIDGAVMITASHLPYDRNGMKFFTGPRGLNSEEIEIILKKASKIKFNNSVNSLTLKTDYTDAYSKNLVSLVRQKTALNRPLEGFKIIIDAGNGSGGFFVDKVLKTLGANTDGSIFLEADGMFPNHVPNPENANVMRNFSQHTKQQNADLGILFDTDVDRAAFAGSDGTPIGGSRLIALISDIVLREYPNTCIVTDSVTSASLKDFIISRGGTHHRFKRGYNNVINEAKRLNAEGTACHLAVETSGHCALSENDFLDDGAYLAVKILIHFAQLRKSGLSLSDSLSGYKQPAAEEALRFEIDRDDYKQFTLDLLRDFEKYAGQIQGWSAETPNYEGVRISCSRDSGCGWVLMRGSLHDPQIAVNIESDCKEGIEIIKRKVSEFIQNYSGRGLRI